MINLFSNLYDYFMIPLEKLGVFRIRKKLIKKAYGNVLEVGSGTGVSFNSYKNVNSVYAIEPDDVMRLKSVEKKANCSTNINIVSASGENLPFENDLFDVILSALVFCTIVNPEAALQEVSRVCKPGGKVLFFEHVRVNNPIIKFVQNLLNPVWKKMCGGCNLNRDTLKLIEETELKITKVRTYLFNIFTTIECTKK